MSCVAFLLCCGCAGGHKPDVVGGNYVVQPFDDGCAEDVRWADYLSGQIQRRARDGKASADGRLLEIHVRVDAALSNDFIVERKGDALHLSARDGGKMLWLAYQFLSSRSAQGIDASDLPPAFVSMEGDKGDFAFEYRGIYTPSNADPERMPITASHNVDYDWALWGHNLRRVFKDEVIPEEARAWVDGKRVGSQFCFSSEALYEAVCRYVENHGGDDETSRFAVMPNDNDQVCLCAACKAEGNTPSSATPAVSKLLDRLARRYPEHLFFTSSYMTTVEPPASPLPSNVGVLISSMSVSMQEKFKSRPATKRFAKLVGRWREKAGRIYVWDYMRNFDDYFTPYPCLRLLQQRLLFFRSIGVDGVFFNGSAPTYASFDDVQTAAIAALLVRPELPVAAYADSCFARFYPVAADVLAPAYRAWEDSVARSRAPLLFYGGIGDAVKAWLSPDGFGAFCDSLDAKAKWAGEAERSRLNRLLTALWFTRLELLRRPGGGYTEEQAQAYLEGLGGYTAFPELSDYREANGSTAHYIKEWEELMDENRRMARNRLRGVGIEAVSRPDAAYSDLSALTDGVCGLSSDYHTGWVVASSGEVVWRIPAGRVRSGEVLRLSFLHVPKWRILLPQRVEVRQAGRVAGAVDVQGEEGAQVRREVSCKLGQVDSSQPLELHLVQRKGGKRVTLACDEVAVLDDKAI